ncbi:hypothetical protein BIY26_22090 [Brenneria goodwinii]|uniref:Uncharacterized protein n=1 Tax=Brenneria goodwinii TaxID=1109412 RepID=A0AAE8EMD7_9GAMM|nr:hypothetical protein AWC36_09980 [Brenneria goodwinii]RLM16053.1 hypothetical protein BIY28_23205 [Brenneria goodwinii]RLM16493.1 hypothetical protein BIY26_22090 [Brenneria goodwinii]
MIDVWAARGMWQIVTHGCKRWYGQFCHATRFSFPNKSWNSLVKFFKQCIFIHCVMHSTVTVWTKRRGVLHGIRTAIRQILKMMHFKKR